MVTARFGAFRYRSTAAGVGTTPPGPVGMYCVPVIDPAGDFAQRLLAAERLDVLGQDLIDRRQRRFRRDRRLEDREGRHVGGHRTSVVTRVAGHHLPAAELAGVDVIHHDDHPPRDLLRPA